MMRKFA